MYNVKWALCLILTALVLSSYRTGGDKDDWRLGADKEGIKVYTKKSEQGKIRTSRAEMFLFISPDKVIAALLDFDGYAKWFPSCVEAKMLKRISDHEFISHLIYKTPWPLPNVDCVQRMTIDKRIADTIYIHVKAEPDFIGPSGSCARVKQLAGDWKIVYANGGSMLTNIYYSDMGGIIPYWLANTQSVDIPFNIFHNMRDYVLNGKAKK
jgi:hypothetical protein